MSTAAEIRARIASGELKKSTGGGGVAAGKFGILIEAAEYGLGESGGKRGKLVCKVITAEEKAEIGKHFNHYIQTKDQTFMERSIAEFAEYCKVWGIEDARLYDRAETGEDIVINMMSEINRLAIKGILVAGVTRKPQGKNSPKGQPLYWTNWDEVGLASTPHKIPVVEAPRDPSADAATVQAIMDSLPPKQQTLTPASANSMTLDAVLQSTGLAPATVTTPTAVTAPATTTPSTKKPWEM